MMIFKLFPWVTAVVRRCLFAADTVLRVRHASRRRLGRTGEAFDARAHPLRGSYLGLLASLDVIR